MQFPDAEACDETHGPIYMDAATQNARRLDQFEPDTTEKEKTLKELKDDLVAK